MSKVLSQLLDAKEPAFSRALTQLEEQTGHPSLDVSLTADIVGKVHRKIRELGLDPSDTTAKELYHGLQAMVALHDTYLSQIIGTSIDDELSNQLKAIEKAINDLPLPKKTWALKHSVAKKILKNHPPKKVMKQLGYKSIDSLLKREQVDEIIAATRFLETKAWGQKLVKLYKSVGPSDFETRQIKVVVLDKERWGDSADAYIYASKQNITHLKELGIILILPLPVKHIRGAVITILPLVLHYINEIRSYSAFFKMQQVRPDFHKVLIETLLDDKASTTKYAGQQIHWRIVQRHFGEQDPAKHPELFEPHVQPDDLHWRKAESVMYWLEPALKFWEGLDYVAALYPSTVVPLSLMDNAASYCNNLELGQQSLGRFRSSLWNEIFARYIGQENFEQAILAQLNKQVLEPELVEI
jgi:hypothetical protein